MRLVGGIDVAPERVLRLVEDDREMGRLHPPRPVANELEHFGREQPHRAGRQAVGSIVVLLILSDRLIVGAKDKGGAVDEKNVVAGADRAMGLGHGHHISDAHPERHWPRLPLRQVSLAPFIVQSSSGSHFRSNALGRVGFGGRGQGKARWVFAAPWPPPRRRRLRLARASNCAPRNRSPFRTRASSAPQIAPRFAAASTISVALLATSSRLPHTSSVPSGRFSCRRLTCRCPRLWIRIMSTPARAPVCSVPLSPGSRRGSIRPTS